MCDCGRLRKTFYVLRHSLGKVMFMRDIFFNYGICVNE